MQLRDFGVLFTGIAGVLGFAAAGAAAPTTPDRPGRPTQEQAGVPNQPSTTQPSAQNPSLAPSGDEDFLRGTAGALGIRAPEQRPDEELLRWFGHRATLEGAGIDFEGSWTADYSSNFRGGANTAGYSFRDLLDLRVNVDTRALFGFYGGTFSLDYQNQNGTNGSDRLTGDVQGFDNADADGRSQISEIWYQQLLLDDKLRLKIGKVDANSEFAFPENGAPFVNSSFGHSPTLFPMPTYPDGSMSANVFVYPAPWLYGGAGIYDGSGADGVVTGSYGPKHFFSSPNDYYVIGEVGTRWVLAEDTMPGRLAVGGWWSNADFDRFDGGVDSGAEGFYSIFEQTLWHKKYYDKTDAQGIAAFLQYGYADKSVSEVTDHIGAGLVWTGPLPSEKRQDDQLGIGVSYAHLSNEPGAGFTKDSETSIELFYGLQVTPYLLIKPDLQYIINPGGDDAADALVATVRVTLAF